MTRSAPLLLLLAACATTPPPGAARDTVGVHTTPGRTFDTNLYWIPGPEGTVLIDTGFLAADVEAAVAEAEAATKRPVVAAVVLHPNPDKFNGAHALLARGIRVLTSRQVAEQVPAVHRLRHAAFADRYPGEYPGEAPTLEIFGDATTELMLGGAHLTLHVLGRGCSEAHVAVSWRGHIFVGDLVAHHTHSWLELGYLEAWQDTLRTLAALQPRRVHPGRGTSGGPALLEEQQAYLQTVIDLVRARRPTLPLSREDRDGLVAAMEARFPGYPYAVFLRVGMSEVVRRLLSPRS